MAIKEKENGKFLVRLRGCDGAFINKTFSTKRDALRFETELRRNKQQGLPVSGSAMRITLNDYFEVWISTIQTGASAGWKTHQQRLYRDYISSILGGRKFQNITPEGILDVLNQMKAEVKAPQTQRHVFNLLRKIFQDAIEISMLLHFNPVLKKLKPEIPMSETRHLNLSQVKTLLQYVEDKPPYGLAIWAQTFLGLRVGELQSLKWEDLDLENGIVHVRSTFVRNERIVKPCPKEGKHRSRQIPPELLEKLRQERLRQPKESLVANSPQGGMLSYEHYARTLKRYCRELGIPTIGTHGLRHSTSGLYLSHGASPADIQQLFNHSSEKVTSRYIHHHDSHLEKVTQKIQLFPKGALNVHFPPGNK